MVGKELIRGIITEAIDEEMDRIRYELQQWKSAELESLINATVSKEIQKMNLIPTLSTGSGAAKGEKL